MGIIEGEKLDQHEVQKKKGIGKKFNFDSPSIFEDFSLQRMFLKGKTLCVKQFRLGISLGH